MPTSGQRNSCIIETERLCCLWCTTWGRMNNWALGLQYNTALPAEHCTYNTTQHCQLSTGPTIQQHCQMAGLQLLWCKDKEMTKTEAMKHQNVNIMTKNKVEHLRYNTHLVHVNEWDGAITLITINSNPPRWRVSDNNPEHEYKMVISKRHHAWDSGCEGPCSMCGARCGRRKSCAWCS